MGILSKKPKKEEIEVSIPETTAPKCACGEPIATELGQTSVCKSHIRTN